jgi:hypothetical protein
MPRPLPPAPKPKPAPRPIPQPAPTVKPEPIPPRPKPRPGPKPVDPDFGGNVPKPDNKKPLRYTFTFRDMMKWYSTQRKGTSITWRGRRFRGVRAPFGTMTSYFVRVISRKPSVSRYQWLYKIVQCILRREPANNRQLRNWVQTAIRGNRNRSRNYKVPACVRHLWRGRLNQKPTYHDLASLVRFAIYNRRITYRSMYLFTWAVLNENKPAVSHGHTDFWKQFSGIKQQYQSGLTPNSKFMILNSSKKIIMGNTIRSFKKLNERNYFYYDQHSRAIRWLGKEKAHLGVVGGLRAGSRVRLVRSAPGKNVRRQDWFTYSSVDMRFHSWMNKELCITFNNPRRDGEQMVLQRCNCKNGNQAGQEFMIKYFQYNKHNGFQPWRVFTLASQADSRMALSVSNDGALLLPSQRYAKVAFQSRNNDAERFYWDPRSKCLKNYQFNDGCIGTAKQGCQTHLIALGQSSATGRNCAEVKFDGTFFWVNGQVAQPTGGYTKTNNIQISLNEMNGNIAQRWRIKYSNTRANRQKSRQQSAPATSNWGWEQKKFFEIRAYNGQVVFVDKNGRVGLRRRQNNADEQFAFDAKSKTIVSRRNRQFSLASKQVGNARFKLVARKTQRTSNELFTRPSNAGIVQMAANKNYVWRVDGNSISIVPGNGSRNWRRSRTYFQTVNR